MPPQRTQITCPQCRQPVPAIVEQLFDVTSDPGAKQRLLGGVSNFAACRNCGFNGPLATPIVYHDADKELLLTYFPGELNMPVTEQEKLIGPMITKVTNSLPAEKRKGYLLRPQNFLTYDSLVERVLGADGITPEMIKAQQQKVGLVERLMAADTPEVRAEIIKAESALLDEEFFAIFSRLMESAAASGQEKLTQQMEAIQQQLMTETEFGRALGGQIAEMQEAVKTLQAVGKELDREKLLEIIIAAPSDERLNALASLTRPGLDYSFFQMLSERIEAMDGEERQKLETLRDKLLETTNRIDKRIEAEYRQASQLLETILAAEDTEQATMTHLGEIDEAFIQVLNQADQEASKKNDEAFKGKLQAIARVLQRASAPPPELALLEELLEAKDDAELTARMAARADAITPEFASFVSSLLARNQEQAGEVPDGENAEVFKRLEAVNRAVLKFSMQKNLG
ncbi:MAG: hypothetical protein JXB85_09045 [Anaerolineales bacterium]|nr:hypothetical protein [Anaerolineales bacterium]